MTDQRHANSTHRSASTLPRRPDIHKQQQELEETMKRKNRLDEMQEQKMLKIEHNGCWLAFWGLFAAFIIQALTFGNDDLKAVAGEGIIFMVLALYIVVSCIKNGIWDRRLVPTTPANLMISAFAGALSALFNAVKCYLFSRDIASSAAAFIFIFISAFLICFAVLSFAMAIYRKIENRLENEDEKEKTK